MKSVEPTAEANGSKIKIDAPYPAKAQPAL